MRGGREAPLPRVGVAPGETLTTVVQTDVACETGDWLPAGDYEVFATITFVAGSGEMEQAQGGPWPLTVGDGDAGALPAPPPGDPVPLPPGSYQAVLLLAAMLDGEPHAVAVTEPVDLELT